MTAILVSFEMANPPLFPLGELIASPSALDAVPEGEIIAALARHVSGDWGDIDEDDQRSNKRAMETGGRLISAYTSKSGINFSIITEASVYTTHVFLPEEN